MLSTAIKKLASLFFMLGFTLLGFVVLVVSVVLMISLEALRIAIAIQTNMISAIHPSSSSHVSDYR
jgi:hypothetical protein